MTPAFSRPGALLRRMGIAPVRRMGIAPVLLLLAALAPLPERGGASIAGLPTLCVFRHWTGLPCALCGMTRALVCCGHGLWAEAALYHPLGPLAFFAIVLWTAARLFPDHAFRSVRARAPWAAPVAFWSVIALLLGVWWARLAGWLPAPP